MSRDPNEQWRVWCPECGRPFGRHQWGANRGKPIVMQHLRAGAPTPRGLTPAQRGAWLRSHACAGSLAYGRRVTADEEAALAAAPSSATLRVLAVLAAGEMGLRDFALAMYPDADWESASRVGARGGLARGAQPLRAAASRLAALVRGGWVAVRTEGEGSATRRLWRLLPKGESALRRGR